MGFGMNTLSSLKQFLGTGIALAKEVPLIAYNTTLMAYRTVTSVFTYHIFTQPIKPFHNQVALIIGSDSCLGRAFANQFAKLNGRVICVDLSKERGDVFVQSINDTYGEDIAYFYECDVRRQEALAETIKAITKDVGDVTVLINCSTVDLLLASYYNAYKLLLPIMKGNQKGRIVFIKSFDAASRNVIQGLYESVHDDLESSKTEKVATTIAYVFPRIGQDGEKNKVFGNILPEALAEEVLEGIARNRKEVYVPEYMIYMFWFRMLPSPITGMIEKFLFHDNQN